MMVKLTLIWLIDADYQKPEDATKILALASCDSSGIAHFTASAMNHALFWPIKISVLQEKYRPFTDILFSEFH